MKKPWMLLICLIVAQYGFSAEVTNSSSDLNNNPRNANQQTWSNSPNAANVDPSSSYNRANDGRSGGRFWKAEGNRSEWGPGYYNDNGSNYNNGSDYSNNYSGGSYDGAMGDNMGGNYDGSMDGSYAQGSCGSAGGDNACCAPAQTCCEPECPPTICYVPCCKYVPQYYTVRKCEYCPKYTYKKCCNYVPQYYQKCECKYVPQYSYKTCCKYCPQYSYKCECTQCPRYYCERRCTYKPCYYYKCVKSPTTNPCVEQDCSQ